MEEQEIYAEITRSHLQTVLLVNKDEILAEFKNELLHLLDESRLHRGLARICFTTDKLHYIIVTEDMFGIWSNFSQQW